VTAESGPAPTPASHPLDAARKAVTGRIARWRSFGGPPLDEAPAPAAVDPRAEPYEGGDGPNGVLLVHGFGGSAHSMRGWAEHLERDGFRVSVPRLPGHGTSWQEMGQTRWEDWYAEVEAAFDALRARCDTVFVCGLSMGGSLSLLLAERQGPAVAGLCLVNPVVTSKDKRAVALPVLRHLVKSLPGIANDIALPGADECAYARAPLSAAYSMTLMWKEVRAQLDRVDQPLLMFRSVQDHVVDYTSGQAIMGGVGSRDLTEQLLHRSYHVATMDFEAEEIFTGSSEFFHRLLKDRDAAPE
jgi:carboxylesterase